MSTAGCALPAARNGLAAARGGGVPSWVCHPSNSMSAVSTTATAAATSPSASSNEARVIRSCGVVSLRTLRACSTCRRARRPRESVRTGSASHLGSRCSHSRNLASSSWCLGWSSSTLAERSRSSTVLAWMAAAAAIDAESPGSAPLTDRVHPIVSARTTGQKKCCSTASRIMYGGTR